MLSAAGAPGRIASRFQSDSSAGGALCQIRLPAASDSRYMTYLQAQVMNRVPPLYPSRSLAMARTAAVAASIARSPGSTSAADRDQRRLASLRAACSSRSYRRARAASRPLGSDRRACTQSCGSSSPPCQAGVVGLLSGRASAIVGCYLPIHRDFIDRLRKWSGIVAFWAGRAHQGDQEGWPERGQCTTHLLEDLLRGSHLVTLHAP